MFRDRPLTWLFVTAIFLIDVILASTLSTESNWQLFLAFLLGQSAVLGAWLAVGQLHRLARGALFLGCLLGLVGVFQAVITNLGYVSGSWGREIDFIYTYASAAFLSALVWRYFLTKLLSDRKEFGSLRFPLIELFGWTIVVAIGALIVRRADFSEHADYSLGLILFLVSSAQAGFSVALLIPPHPVSRRLLFLAIATESAFLLLLFWSPGEFFEFAWSHIIVVLWLLMQRLDYASSQLVTQMQSPT